MDRHTPLIPRCCPNGKGEDVKLFVNADTTRGVNDGRPSLRVAIFSAADPKYDRRRIRNVMKHARSFVCTSYSRTRPPFSSRDRSPRSPHCLTKAVGQAK